MRSAVIKELGDIKAEEIVTIGLNGKSDIADYMIVATGRSQRQVGAAADRVRLTACAGTSCSASECTNQGGCDGTALAIAGGGSVADSVSFGAGSSKMGAGIIVRG